jgi:hypothetical protein
MKRLLALAGIVMMLAAYHTPIDATTVEARSLREMAAEAPSIVHGTVVATSSRWNDNRSLIVTDIRIEVHEVLKGDDISEVVVTQPGGAVGNLRVDADGAVIFSPGEEAILFLNRSSRGHTYVVGLSQGRFHVDEDPQGRKLVRGLDPEHLNVIRSSAAPAGADPTPGAGGRGVPLDQFLGGVRDLVGDAVKEGGQR